MGPIGPMRPMPPDHQELAPHPPEEPAMFNRISRRQVLKTAGAGFGYVALAGMIGQAAEKAAPKPLAPREPHFPAKAKRIIFLFMEGAMSQMDTFEYKAQLQ